MRLIAYRCSLLLLLAAVRIPADELEGRFLELLNVERQRRALPALSEEPDLASIARAHSREMLAAGRIYHDSPQTGSSADRVSHSSVLFSQSGENVAQGPDVEFVHTALMESQSHRENMLDPGYTHVGIGVSAAGLHIYVTEIFVRLIPKRDGEALAAELMDRIAAERSSRGLPTLRQSEMLGRAARSSVSEMQSHDRKSPERPPMVVTTGRVRMLAFVGETPNWQVLGRELLSPWDEIGVGATQGRSKSWPGGANWYVILFYSRE